MLTRSQVKLSMALVAIAAIAPMCGCVKPDARANGQPVDAKAITLYCGGGVRKPVAECVRDFHQQTGIEVNATYGPSPRMFDQVCEEHGDVYLAGDIHFMQVAKKQGDVLASQTVCYVVPVIVVQRGNPKGIARVADLGRPGVHFYLIASEQCQQGYLGERLLAQQGVGATAIRSNRVSELPAERDVPSMFATGELDAAILWQRGTKAISDKVDVIELPELQQAACPVAAVILRWSRNRPAAERLLKYLAGSDGQQVFLRHGFRLEPPAAQGRAEGSVQP